MNFSAGLRLRIVLPPLAALGGVLAVTVIAADAAGISGAESWALRPVQSTAAADVRETRSIPQSDLPGEPRTVRIVYQGYGPASAVRPTR